jgi:hypothetical protein
MSAQTIINNEYATLFYHPDTKIVHHTFHKPIGGDHFRSILNTGVETMGKNGAQKWLSDDRNNAAMSQEDTDWSQADWFPRAMKAGWKFWAIVVPHDIMGRMNMKEFVDMYYEQGLRIMVFTNPDEAMKWLAAQ